MKLLVLQDVNVYMYVQINSLCPRYTSSHKVRLFLEQVVKLRRQYFSIQPIYNIFHDIWLTRTLVVEIPSVACLVFVCVGIAQCLASFPVIT